MSGEQQVMNARALRSFEKRAPQQRYAAARSAVPSRKSAADAASQLLSPVLGSVAATALVALGLVDVDAVVLVTVVLDVVAVLGDIAAGFTAGSAVGSVPGCSVAGPTPPAGSPVPHPGT